MMKINKKQLGSSLRRGALAGGLGGFVAGWLAFAASAAIGPTGADARADGTIDEPAAAVPMMPSLRPVPTPTAGVSASATSGEGIGLTVTPSGVASTASGPAPVQRVTAAAAPVFVPVAPLAAPVVKPVATTKVSPVRK